MNRRALLPAGLVLGLLGALFLGLGAVSADPPGTNGTVKIHEGLLHDEPMRNNEPHVCTFHLHFYGGDEVQQGGWWIVPWPPTADDTNADPVRTGTYDATNGEAVVLDAGDVPFELAAGHYRLYWEGSQNPGGVVPVKHKVFWVTCEEPAPTDVPTAAPTDVPTAAPTDVPTAAPTDVPREGTLPSTSMPGTGIDPGVVGGILLIVGAGMGLVGLTDVRAPDVRK